MKKFIFFTLLGSFLFIIVGMGFFYRDFYNQVFNELRKQFNLLTGWVPDRYEDPEAFDKWVTDINGDIILINRLRESDFEVKDFKNYVYLKPKSWEIDEKNDSLHKLKVKDGGELSIAITTFTNTVENVTLLDGSVGEVQFLNINSDFIDSNSRFQDISNIKNLVIGETLNSKSEGKVFSLDTSYYFNDNSDIKVYRFTEGVVNERGIFESDIYSNYSVVYINEKDSTALFLDFIFPAPNDLLDDRNDLAARYFNVIDERFNIKW